MNGWKGSARGNAFLILRGVSEGNRQALTECQDGGTPCIASPGLHYWRGWYFAPVPAADNLRERYGEARSSESGKAAMREASVATYTDSIGN
jgi:hypothetical protein